MRQSCRCPVARRRSALWWCCVSRAVRVKFGIDSYRTCANIFWSASSACSCHGIGAFSSACPSMSAASSRRPRLRSYSEVPTMRLLPEILGERREANRVELSLHVPADLVYFEGHFPGLPILPGVVQIDWSIRLARARLPVRGGFVAAEQLKFLSIVRPAAHLTLTLELNAEKTRMNFSYAGKDRKYS